MSYTNVYPSRINWENEPSIVSPINATNLNKMDYALYEMDGTLDNWDTTKANQSDLLLCVKSIDYDDETGEFVFTWQNGTTKTVDLNIEKIPVSFSMDANGVITMTTDDGTTYTADVGSLIKTYTFTDSTEIDFTVTTDASGNKTVTAALVAGSITGDKLEPNYLANCQSAANSASGSATAADGSAEDSEAWAVGERDGVPVPSTDPAYQNNSKWWANHTSNSLAGLTDVNITTPTDGEVLKYDGANSEWVNGQAAAGGGSTVVVTTSESSLYGQSVTLSDGATTLTETFSNSGEATFSGVTLTGSVTISASSGGQTASKSLTMPYFGNYTAVLSFFTATITVTFDASKGATCTLDGVTASTSPHTFTVNSAGTYTASCTLDGVTKQGTAKVITTDGQAETDTIEYGTINLTYDDDFRGLSITCVNDGTTITKTAPSGSNSMAFYPPTTGSWTISGTYSGTTYVSSPNPVTVSSLSTPVSATLQTLAQITATIYSATEDTVTFTDAAGVSHTEVFASGQSSKSITFKILPAGSSITFTSSVAKDPSDLTADYSKTVTITENTTDIYLMPDNALYWWGYESSNLENMNTTNGWSVAGRTFGTPAHNTNTITIQSAATSEGGAVGVGTQSALAVTKCNVISKGQTSPYGRLAMFNSKSPNDLAKYLTFNSASDALYSITQSGTYYIGVYAIDGAGNVLSALWYE